MDMDARYFGLWGADVRRLAYQLAIRKRLLHPFSNDKAAAGNKWLKSFFRRHPSLSMRSPQGISAARAKSFTPENVRNLFSILERELDRTGHSPSRILNVDETGITMVQREHQKAVSLKDKRQVASLTSAERGNLCTLIACMNTAGACVPPMLIFSRKNMNPELMAGAISYCHPPSWIQQHSFTQWLQHLLSFAKPTNEDPAVLVFDGHCSHTRNLDVIDMARENHVSLVCLPPHSTHRMQPLDVAFMRLFKTYYTQEMDLCYSSMTLAAYTLRTTALNGIGQYIYRPSDLKC
jgi:hypothetical protein